MSCQDQCKDCVYWEPGWQERASWGRCGLASVKEGMAIHGLAPLIASTTGPKNSELYTRDFFGCNQFAKNRGREFVKLVETLYRTVDEEYDDVARKPRGVAFAILTLLDGSGENWTGESRFRVCTEQDGEWRPVDFMHHDLDSGK